MAEEMTTALERNCREAGIKLWAPDNDKPGYRHVIGPELGLTQPGMTIACGDSHTSTHGALGAIAFRIGTSRCATCWRRKSRPRSAEGAADRDQRRLNAASIQGRHR